MAKKAQYRKSLHKKVNAFATVNHPDYQEDKKRSRRIARRHLKREAEKEIRDSD